MSGERPPTDIVAWMRDRRPAHSAAPRQTAATFRRVPPPLDWRPWDLLLTCLAAALLAAAILASVVSAPPGGTDRPAHTPPERSLPLDSPPSPKAPPTVGQSQAKP
ncbi:hypothetical protein [Azospirillum lipoferum]|uniref:hypothetical protein n=1 Tax=Azospirillum lipoferum TaxID=193 RepID=UPI0013960734|nr:hypothetical protein [Azospirillum lipoferum]